MDTDGRVIRLDSLSKLVAPGMRMGWVSGPSAFIEKYMLLQESTAQVCFIAYVFLPILEFFLFLYVPSS